MKLPPGFRPPPRPSSLPPCQPATTSICRKSSPGVTTQAEVRARASGEPGFIHWNDDGTATWEYARQPNGSNCYMITFSQDRVVAKVEQVLNETNYAKVRVA